MKARPIPLSPPRPFGRSLRAQASLEALMVLLLFLILLQLLASSLPIFNPAFSLQFSDSSERQTLAAQALAQSVRIDDSSVRLPLSWSSPILSQPGYLVSARNASIRVPILPPAQSAGAPV